MSPSPPSYPPPSTNPPPKLASKSFLVRPGTWWPEAGVGPCMVVATCTKACVWLLQRAQWGVHVATSMQFHLTNMDGYGRNAAPETIRLLPRSRAGPVPGRRGGWGLGWIRCSRSVVPLNLSPQ